MSKMPKLSYQKRQQIKRRIKKKAEDLKKDFFLLSEHNGFLKYIDTAKLEEFKNGIYFLYYKGSLQYIGTATTPTTLVYTRLRQCVQSSHTFFVKWQRKHSSKMPHKLREDLKKNLRIRIILCDSFAEQLKLEHFAIGVFSPPFNDKIEE